MKQFLSLGLLVSLFSFAALSTVGCGTDPCDELEDRCGGCTDASSKLSCDLTVALSDSDACDAALDQLTTCP